MSFCFLYNVVLENYSVQNSPWGEGGLLPAQGLLGFFSKKAYFLKKKKNFQGVSFTIWRRSLLFDDMIVLNYVKLIQRTLAITTVFVTKDLAVKSNLLL